MERIITEQSTSNLEQSTLSQKRKLSLIRAFRKSNHTELIHHKPVQSSQSNQNNPTQENKIAFKVKSQRHSTLVQGGFQQTNQPTSVNINTKEAVKINKQNTKKKNIFDNDYVNSLKKGFTNVYEEPSQIIPKSIDLNQFYGPVYYSERPTEPRNNPQRGTQPIIIEQEVYKFDKNPKLLKFKVNLKRQNTNLTQNTHSLSKINQKKNTSRILITQLRTEDSKLSQNRSQLQSRQSIIRKLQPLKQRLHTQSYSTHIKPKSLKIPKLSEQSNLFKSIKIFERKQNLLGQIEHHRGLQAKYGDKMFENLVRNNYEQIEKQNDFIVKVHYKSNNEPKQDLLKSKFIKDIQQGKYPTNFKYKERLMPLKLKGMTKTMPRYETILYDDE